MRHFTHYLRFKPFVLVVDHKPLLAWRDITTQRDATNRRTRWAIELSTYEFEMLYKEGKRHADADALSRHPEPDEPDETEEDEEIISLLTTAPPVYICHIAAKLSTEIPLAEIHFDEMAIDEMKIAQNSDPDISQAIQLIISQNSTKASWKKLHSWYLHNRHHFVVCDGILYHNAMLSSTDEPVARVVIPESKRREMLYRVHGHMQAGHPSQPRALSKLEKFAVWPGVRKQANAYVAQCAECQGVRNKVPKLMAPVQAQEAFFPLEYVQADLYYVGKTYDKKDYILVFEDRATKHCRLFAIKNTEARGVAACLEAYVTQLGCPDRWGTDGGKEFFDRLILAMCQVFNIKKEFALAYRPQSQGQTERKNRTIKSELIKRIHQFGSNWPSMLKWIEFSYNTTVHPSHGFTPFLLMFGREPRLPVEQDLPHINTKGWNTSMKSFFSDFLDRFNAIRQEAAIKKNDYNARMIAQKSQKVLPPLQSGTQVIRTIPSQLPSKTSMPVDGPWKVVEQRVKDGKKLPVYIIKDDKQNTLFSHRQQLTPFTEPILKTQPETELEKAPEPKSRQKEEVTDGPASRTRSRRKQILSLVIPKPRATPDPTPPVNPGQNNAQIPLQSPPHQPPSSSHQRGDGNNANGGSSDDADDDDDTPNGDAGDDNDDGDQGGNPQQRQRFHTPPSGEESDDWDSTPNKSTFTDENRSVDRFNDANYLTTPEFTSADNSAVAQPIAMEDLHGDADEENAEATIAASLIPSQSSSRPPRSDNIEENAERANTQSLIASAVKRHQETTSSRPPLPPLPIQPPFNVIRPLSSSTASLPRTGAKACPPIKRTLSATSTRTDEEEIPQELEGGGQRLASYNRLSSSDDPSELAPIADVAINADNNDPLFEGGRVMEMVTNKSGVVTSVRRSQRNRENE